MEYTKEEALKAFFDDYDHYKKCCTGPSTTAKELLETKFHLIGRRLFNELELNRKMHEALKEVKADINIVGEVSQKTREKINLLLKEMKS